MRKAQIETSTLRTQVATSRLFVVTQSDVSLIVSLLETSSTLLYAAPKNPSLSHVGFPPHSHTGL